MDNYPRIIAVTAPSRRSGKGTISSLLAREYGYTACSYAVPIKTMFIALCMHQGVDPTYYQRILDGDMKETPVVGPLSLRSFAEGVGTTWGRNMIDERLWVDIASQKINKLLDQGHRVVIDDTRFANEAALARELGGEVWSVRRPIVNGGFAPTLASEGHMLNYDFDWVFPNIGSVVDLEGQVRRYMGAR